MKKLYMAIICALVASACGNTDGTVRNLSEDELPEWHAYAPEEDWKTALDFLRNTDFENIGQGTYELNANGVYATVTYYMTKDSALFEAHRRYIDIQYLAKGKEIIEIGDIKDKIPAVDYDSLKDIEFFTMRKYEKIVADSSSYLVLFPEDAHRPCMKIGEKQNVRKVVVKIPYMRTPAPEPVRLQYDSETVKNGLESETEHINAKGHISCISEAGLLFYPVNGSDQVVMIIPGGAYKELAIDYEGIKTAKMLNEHGISAAILKYRMPNGNPEVAEQDIAAAMKTILTWAETNNRQKVTVMGFSAGGHLAAMSITLLSKDIRPDRAVLVYPVISMDFSNVDTNSNLLGCNPSEELCRKYSLENHVDADTPPVLLVLTADDKAVNPENSMRFCRQLINSSVPVQMMMFPEGNHGWWMRERYKYGDITYKEILKWIKGSAGNSY